MLSQPRHAEAAVVGAAVVLLAVPGQPVVAVPQAVAHQVVLWQ